MQLSDWLIMATQRLISSGISADEARLEARLLAQHALGFTREQLITRSHVLVDPAELEPLLSRRVAREPLAYITGERAFYGLEFYVTPAVLIPRPETELLVDTALEYFSEMPPPPPSISGKAGTGEPESVSSAPSSGTSVPRNADKTGAGGAVPAHGGGTLADIGTGSGCIAISLAKHLPQTQVFATDISKEALAVAQRNAERNGVGIALLQGDLLAPLPEGTFFDVIVSNPPYIARSEADTLAPEVLDEPHMALFDTEADGLGFYRRLATEAPAHLQQNGLLAVEVGQGQAEPVAELFTAAGFNNVEILPDLAGIGRVVRGIWRPWPKTAGDEVIEPL
ncbi:MAG: HemK/PrmC family methyltransferase [Armatimonas sp.]